MGFLIVQRHQTVNLKTPRVATAKNNISRDTRLTVLVVVDQLRLLVAHGPCIRHVYFSVRSKTN